MWNDLVGSIADNLLDQTAGTLKLQSGDVSITAIKDEDDMVSDSATALATQQSIKAFVSSGTVTLTNKTLTSPKVGTAIADTNGNELIKVTATSSAVNEITLANSATSAWPSITASGGDENIGIVLGAKGTGGIQIPNTTSTVDGAIGFDRTNENLSIGDGSASQTVHMGAWVAFTPSWTNLTAGAGTNTGAYCKIGKTVHFRVFWKFGAGAAVGTGPTLTIPVALKTYDSTNTIIGNVTLEDSGTGLYQG